MARKEKLRENAKELAWRRQAFPYTSAALDDQQRRLRDTRTLLDFSIADLTTYEQNAINAQLPPSKKGMGSMWSPPRRT
jgi:hypothetical protein